MNKLKYQNVESEGAERSNYKLQGPESKCACALCGGIWLYGINMNSNINI